MSDPVARLNAALEGHYAIERELGGGGTVDLPPRRSEDQTTLNIRERAGGQAEPPVRGSAIR